MKKVKITQKQASLIEEKLNEMSRDKVVNAFVKLNGISNRHFHLDELIRAIYIGYEVEPEFKVGDWIYVEKYNGETKVATKVTSIYSESKVRIDRKNLNNTDLVIPKSAIRHATPDEIAEEKTRRWWADHDREVRYIRVKDVINVEGAISEVIGLTDAYIDFGNRGFMAWKTFNSYCEKGVIKIVCFAEDRKDI